MQTNQCKIRLLDEVFAVVVGLADHHLESLSNRFAVQAPNYFFNPRFKLGQWDGKIRYFQKTGRTYVYLLDEIIPLLVQYGYQLQLEDLRPLTKVPEPIDANLFAHVLHPDDQQPIILRDYQYKNVNLLTEHGNGLFIASTGAGKTLTSAALCHAYGQLGIKTLTIVPNQDLITNTKKDFINCGLDTGEYSGTCKDLTHQHIVSTWQALQKNAKVVELFGMVLVDECLAGDTKVTMSDMTEKLIKDIVCGDRVLTMNEDTGRLEEDVVVKRHENLMASSEEQMYELTFDTGAAIQITGNHKCQTENRGWVRADELTSDDEVISIHTCDAHVG